MEDNHIEVIGVDHGWANCKTVGSVFVSGVKESRQEKIKDKSAYGKVRLATTLILVTVDWVVTSFVFVIIASLSALNDIAQVQINTVARIFLTANQTLPKRVFAPPVSRCMNEGMYEV